jgi:hypothetical protein
VVLVAVERLEIERDALGLGMPAELTECVDEDRAVFRRCPWRLERRQPAREHSI